MEEYFSPILDKDETIIKVFKPNKTKLYWGSFCMYLLFFFIIFLSFLGSMIGGVVTGELNEWFIALPFAVLLVLYLPVFIFTKIYYNKLYYAYSNKRIIIRTGIIGVDYKSLDLSMIGAVNVYVSLLDKLVGKNTGSITFGSMASPISAGNASSYKFANVNNPYELYKEIKNVIDDYKKKQ